MPIATLTLAALAALPIVQQQASLAPLAAQPETRLAANTTPKADVFGFPLPSADLVLEVSGDSTAPSLYAAFVRYGALTGQQLVVDSDTEEILKRIRIPIAATTTIPAADVLGYLEAVLFANDGVLSVERDETPRILKLTSLLTARRSTARSGARFVASDALSTMRRHPAILVSTVLDLKHVDARQLSNSLRTMITDANTMQILPAGNNSTLVITGFGVAVADLCEHLRLVDDASRPQPRPIAYDVVRLQHAVAVDTAPLVERALSSARALRGTAAPDAAPAPNASDRSSVGIQADVRLNALLITCPPDELAEAKRIIGLLDVK